MAKSKKLLKKSDLKKDLRSHVSQSLETIFKDFEAVVGKRKFRRNIKKASKMLTASVKPEKIVLPVARENAGEKLNGEDSILTTTNHVSV